MLKFPVPFFLASQSPRRKKLLELLNFQFQTFSVDTDESILNGETPIEAALRLAEVKMQEALLLRPNSIILTADTLVALGDKILGKPSDESEAFNYLRELSSNTHKVVTGFCITNSSNGTKIIDFEETLVTFRNLDNEEIIDYINGGSPMDKAGAYGIQDDFGAVFVSRIEGCYYNVVGLPLAKVYSSIKSAL